MKTKLVLALIIILFHNIALAEILKTSHPHARLQYAWKTLTIDNITNTGTSIINAFGSDNKGNLYQTGLLQTNGMWHGIVRKSSDGGYKWNTVDDWGNSSIASGFAADQQGNIYIAGTASFPCYWLIRKSSDGGQTWSNVDQEQDLWGAKSVSVAPNGDIYAGGGSNAGAIVRKSSDGGKTWKTVDTLASATVTAILFDRNGNVYAIGNTHSNKDPKYTWYVRISKDSGNTWSTIDTFLGGMAYSAGIDSAGNVYVAGSVLDENKIYHWIVRKSNKNGGTAIVDDFSSGKLPTAPTALAIDKNDTVFVVGWGSDENNYNSRGIVRMSSNSGTQWSTIDDFPLPDWFYYSKLSFNGILFDNEGQLFTVATINQPVQTSYWLTRKFFGVTH